MSFARRLMPVAGVCFLAIASVATAQIQAPKSPLDRIVMIGASVTAGFTASEPFGGTNTPLFRLSRYLEAAVTAPHQPIQNYAHALFFLQPDLQGRQQIEKALKSQPTLIVGIDFLFWFLYGEDLTEGQRIQRFERGLKLLERVECPLVIGDVPDASGASQEMMPKAAIPAAKTLAAANHRLKEWSAKRKDVFIVTLSDFMRAVVANDALRVHDQTWPRGKTRDLLQPDRLHPTPSGCTALTLAIAGALVKGPNVSTNQFRWNAQEIFESAVRRPKNSGR